jgi:alpha-1,3-mannosylglycoprotein beta-1,4-N-acetylglucosaminyltransferase A/B
LPSNLSFYHIHRYLFRSGNHEHPSDKFYNTTVEVLPDQLNEESIVWQQYNTTTDGYLIIGSFNAFGMAEGSVDNRIGKLRELRLHVHTESENWVILSEVKKTALDKKIKKKKLFFPHCFRRNSN